METVGVAPQAETQRRAVLLARGSVGAATGMVAEAVLRVESRGRGGGSSGAAPAGSKGGAPPAHGQARPCRQGPRDRMASAPAAGAAKPVIASKLILRVRTTIDSTVSRSTTNHSHSSVTIA